jgi:transcription initiation factor TFIIE subunit beta
VDADSLLSYLQNQDSALGLLVQPLKAGWPTVEEGITALEKEHRLLVSRNKKDHHARQIWLDDPTLQAPIDQEFKDLWINIPLPSSVDDTIKELRKMNYQSTGDVTVAESGVRKEKKKRRHARGTKLTNTHMLRDYSTSVKKEGVKTEPGVKLERQGR